MATVTLSFVSSELAREHAGVAVKSVSFCLVGLFGSITFKSDVIRNRRWIGEDVGEDGQTKAVPTSRRNVSWFCTLISCRHHSRIYGFLWFNFNQRQTWSSASWLDEMLKQLTLKQHKSAACTAVIMLPKKLEFYFILPNCSSSKVGGRLGKPPPSPHPLPLTHTQPHPYNYRKNMRTRTNISHHR